MDDQLQLSLDTVDPEAFDTVPEQPATTNVGWSGPEACQIAGITYRQLDYWARTHLAEPSLQQAAGSGSKRLYSYRDLIILKTVKRLLDTGLSLQSIRTVVARLATLGTEDLASASLFSDGATVYQVHTAEEFVDLLNGGQGVFGLALRSLVADTKARLLDFPGQSADDATAGSARDELHARRERKLRTAG